MISTAGIVTVSRNDFEEVFHTALPLSTNSITWYGPRTVMFCSREGNRRSSVAQSRRLSDMFSVGGNDMEIRIHMHRTVVFITTATLLYSRRYRRRRRGPEEHSPKEDVVRHYALCLLPTLTTVDCNESYYFRYCVVLILPYVVSVSSYYFSNVDT